MARKFEAYRIKNGDDLGDPATLNTRFQDLDFRIDVMEGQRTSLDEAIGVVQTVGLQIMNEAIVPIVANIKSHADLGAILIATTPTEIDTHPGTKVLEIPEDQREMFAPAAYLSVFKASDHTVGFLARRVAYDSDTGLLTIDADDGGTGGDALYTDWIVSVANNTDTVTDRVAAANSAIAAAASATVATTEADIATAKATQTAGDVVTSSGYRQDAIDAKTAAIAARDLAKTYRDNALAITQLYLGAATADPTVQTDGSALVAGNWYFNTAAYSGAGELRWYSGSAWQSRAVPTGSAVASFNTRTGAVVAASGDYNAGQITFTPTGSIAASTVQAALAEVASEYAAADALLAVKTRLIGVGGLLSGGGDLTADRTITLTAASQAQAEAGLDNATGMTPLRTAQAIAALTTPTPDASTSVKGKVQLATNTDGDTGTSTTLVPPVAVTKHMITTAVAALVNSSPSALDTLSELATALGNDVNFSTTMTTALAGKLASSAVSAFMLTVLDDVDAATARTTLGAAATSHNHTASQISDSTAIGRTILTAADGAAVRTAISAAAATHTHASTDISDSTTFGRALLTAASVAAQRTSLGLATVAATGAYSDLSGRPTLATVATTGAYSDLSGKPTLGTAAALNVGTAASNVVQLNGSAQLPALDGSLLTSVVGVWPSGYLYGLTLSRASTTTFSVATGAARNEDAGTARNLTLGSVMTKSLSAWAAGTNNGGLDTGAVAASTWYHVHLIRKDSDGSLDVLYSLSVAAPTMPAGYTARRRLGSILTNGSSQIVDFDQKGDEFAWKLPFLDLDVSPPATGATAVALTVPAGVKVRARCHVGMYTATGTWLYTLYSPDVSDPTSLMSYNTTPAAVNIPDTYAYNANSWVFNRQENWTNTSRQLRYYVGGTLSNGRLAIQTDGWVDTRGRV